MFSLYEFICFLRLLEECGGVKYDSNTDVCCGGRTHALVADEECCDGQIISLYSHHCYFGTIRNRITQGKQGENTDEKLPNFTRGKWDRAQWVEISCIAYSKYLIGLAYAGRYGAPFVTGVRRGLTTPPSPPSPSFDLLLFPTGQRYGKHIFNAIPSRHVTCAVLMLE